MAIQTATLHAWPQAYQRHQAMEKLEGMIHSLSLSKPEDKQLASCLLPLLHALNWDGDVRHLSEALPFKPERMDVEAFQATMANLGYSVSHHELSLDKLDKRLLPCLFVPENGAPVVLLHYEHNDVWTVYDSREQRILSYSSSPQGMAYFFAPFAATQTIPTPHRYGWLGFWQMTKRFRPIAIQLFIISCVLSIVVLATPLFIMGVYDHVLGDSSFMTLEYFILGIALALTAEAGFRSLRANMLSYFAARVDALMSTSIFERLLYLPPSLTERAPIASQIARIRDFDSVREFLTSPIAITWLELPFSLLFIGVIYLVAGQLAYVPLAALGGYLLMIVLVRPVVKKRLAASSMTGMQRHELMMETIAKMESIHTNRANTKWQERFRATSGAACLENFRATMTLHIIETLSYVFMMGAAIGTLSFGVYQVMEGHITSGALIATMMLTWRVIGPLQTICSSMARMDHVTSSITQIQRLLELIPEHNPRHIVKPLRNVQGKVTFNRVSLRYSADAEPAVLGVNFEIQPGEVIAIKGDNGSGKSSLLKLITGMYRPQSGTILLDDMDIRQFDPLELRHVIAYVPQGADFFTGTIAENLRLANPEANEKDIISALMKACAYDEIKNLPEGVNTMLQEDASEQFSFMLLQRLNLARAYIKDTPIVIFDEASYSLGAMSDEAFAESVRNMRGQRTVIMVTHREDHMQLADRLFVMDKGILTVSGKPTEVLNHLYGAKK